MKTITIIELLNKIANGEDLPISIEFQGQQFGLLKDKEFNTANYTYADEYNCDRWLFDDLYPICNILNDEVEVLEDEEPIDINDIEELELYSDDGVELYDKKDIHKQGKKINQIIRYLKQSK